MLYNDIMQEIDIGSLKDRQSGLMMCLSYATKNCVRDGKLRCQFQVIFDQPGQNDSF